MRLFHFLNRRRQQLVQDQLEQTRPESNEPSKSIGIDQLKFDLDLNSSLSQSAISNAIDEGISSGVIVVVVVESGHCKPLALSSNDCELNSGHGLELAPHSQVFSNCNSDKCLTKFEVQGEARIRESSIHDSPTSRQSNNNPMPINNLCMFDVEIKRFHPSHKALDLMCSNHHDGVGMEANLRLTSDLPPVDMSQANVIGAKIDDGAKLVILEQDIGIEFADQSAKRKTLPVQVKRVPDREGCFVLIRRQLASSSEQKLDGVDRREVALALGLGLVLGRFPTSQHEATRANNKSTCASNVAQTRSDSLEQRKTSVDFGCGAGGSSCQVEKDYFSSPSPSSETVTTGPKFTFPQVATTETACLASQKEQSVDHTKPFDEGSARILEVRDAIVLASSLAGLAASSTTTKTSTSTSTSIADSTETFIRREAPPDSPSGGPTWNCAQSKALESKADNSAGEPLAELNESGSLQLLSPNDEVCQEEEESDEEATTTSAAGQTKAGAERHSCLSADLAANLHGLADKHRHRHQHHCHHLDCPKANASSAYFQDANLDCTIKSSDEVALLQTTNLGLSSGHIGISMSDNGTANCSQEWKKTNSTDIGQAKRKRELGREQANQLIFSPRGQQSGSTELLEAAEFALSNASGQANGDNQARMASSDQADEDRRAEQGDEIALARCTSSSGELHQLTGCKSQLQLAAAQLKEKDEKEEEEEAGEASVLASFQSAPLPQTTDEKSIEFKQVQEASTRLEAPTLRSILKAHQKSWIVSVANESPSSPTLSGSSARRRRQSIDPRAPSWVDADGQDEGLNANQAQLSTDHSSVSSPRTDIGSKFELLKLMGRKVDEDGEAGCGVGGGGGEVDRRQVGASQEWKPDKRITASDKPEVTTRRRSLVRFNEVVQRQLIPLATMRGGDSGDSDHD